MIDPDQATAAVESFRKERRDTKISLDTPGLIGKEVMIALARYCPADDVAKTIASLMTAKLVRKDGVEYPDIRAQEAGVKLWLAYMVGMPVQRQEVVTVNLDADSEAGMVDRLRSSPALRAQLRKILDSVDDSAAVVIEG
jgi:hypothetical protein